MAKLKKMIKQFPKTLIVVPPSDGTCAFTGMEEKDTFDKLESHEEVVAKYRLVEVCKVKRRVDFKAVKSYESPLSEFLGPKRMPRLPGPSKTKKLKTEAA